MAFFSSRETNEVFGVIVEVGSGSVLTAIVRSSVKDKHPDIIWSHREHAPLKNIDSLEQSAKAVMTAFMQATLQFDTVGRQVLNAEYPNAKINYLQTSISAPWSYTVTKTIKFEQDEEFSITDNLIEELTDAAETSINEELQENEQVTDLGLTIVTKTTMDTLSNGYHVADPVGETAKQFHISRASAVTQQYLVDATVELEQKMVPGAERHTLSFMLLMFSVVRDLLPQTYDICLVDVTFEATEIGIVRDGVLHYSTHTPFGSFSLAREIASALKVPLHEAFSYMQTDEPFAFLDKLERTQKETVEAVLDAYVEKLTGLFHQTGDSLSIPKKVALHSDLKSEPFFFDLVEKAAKRSIKTPPNTILLSREVLKQVFSKDLVKGLEDAQHDTALLLSALFFHKHHSSGNFEYQ